MTLAVTLTIEQLADLVRESVRRELADLQRSDAKEVLTLDEAADLLKRHPKVITKLVREAKLPAHYISEREPRFKRSELLAWLDGLPRLPQATEEP